MSKCKLNINCVICNMLSFRKLNKPVFFLSMLTLPLIIWNCSGFDDRTMFKATYINRASFTIDNTQAPGVVQSDTFILDYADELSGQDTRESKVEFVRLITFIVEFDNKNSVGSQNLDFLKTMKVFMVGEDVKEKLITDSDSIPNSKNYFEMFIDFPFEDDVEAYLKSGKMHLRVEYTTDFPLAAGDTTFVKFGSTYLIDTKKLGI